jgi:hypothetical protein
MGYQWRLYDPENFGPLDKPTIGYFGACVGHFKEAGLRLPLDPLLLELMARMSIQFSCLRLNVIRVVLSVSALNKLLNLKLGLNEILYCYKLAPGASGKIYFILPATTTCQT